MSRVAKISIVLDMGYGDSGKGTTVDFLAKTLQTSGKSAKVVRFSGGSQCGHNVIIMEEGVRKHHTFAQFGSATLRGVPTHYSKYALFDPIAWQKEADHLVELGIKNVRELFTVDPMCPIITEIHAAANRVKETLRGGRRHGSCGRGIGETAWVHEECGSKYRIFVKDFHTRTKNDMTGVLKDLILLYRDSVFAEYRDDIKRLLDEGLVSKTDSMLFLGETSISELEYRAQLIAGHLKGAIDMGVCMESDADAIDWAKEGDHNLIFEGSQGVLIDRALGFFPYVTRANVTDKNVLALLTPSDLRWKEIKVIGVTRTYMVRHGDGPIPSFDEEYTKKLAPRDAYNNLNPWQGSPRCGYLDIPLLRYAFHHMTTVYNREIAITHLDAWVDEDPPTILENYLEAPPDVNSWKMGPLMRLPKSMTRGERAEKIANMIGNCRPGIVSYGPDDQRKEWW